MDKDMLIKAKMAVLHDLMKDMGKSMLERMPSKGVKVVKVEEDEEGAPVVEEKGLLVGGKAVEEHPEETEEMLEEAKEEMVDEEDDEEDPLEYMTPHLRKILGKKIKGE